MYQKILHLDNANDPISLEWGDDYSYLTIRKDGVLIGSFADKAELKLGRRFNLPDQRQIIVVYTELGLELWYNGVELFSKTKSGSTDTFSNAVKMLIWLGGVQLVFIPVLYFIYEVEEKALFFSERIFMAALLLGLGFWAKKTGNKTPFKIAIGFAALNIILTLASGSLSGVPFSGLLIYYMVLGVKGDAPTMPRKQNLDPNTPLDSNL